MSCDPKFCRLSISPQIDMVIFGLNIRITSSDGLKAAQIYKTADEALTYMIGDDCLRDVITQVTVIERTI